jgi:Sec-independent protein translocase protein TatA
MAGSSAAVLAFLNLSPTEVVIIFVVAIVVFGRRLPEVAGQAAGALQRMRRSLDDLRRETGIDREIRSARRAFEDAVPREVRSLDVRRSAKEGLDKAIKTAEVGPEELPPVPPAKRDVGPAQVPPAVPPGVGEPPAAPDAPPTAPQASGLPARGTGDGDGDDPGASGPTATQG